MRNIDLGLPSSGENGDNQREAFRKLDANDDELIQLLRQQSARINSLEKSLAALAIKPPTSYQLTRVAFVNNLPQLENLGDDFDVALVKTKGTWRWYAGDYSALVTQDSTGSVSRARSTNPSGSQGVWVQDNPIVANLEIARRLPYELGQFFLLGRSSPYDGSHGEFKFDSSASRAGAATRDPSQAVYIRKDNATTGFGAFVRSDYEQGKVKARWFGVRSESSRLGATYDNTTALQNAVNFIGDGGNLGESPWAATMPDAGVVELPRGWVRFTDLVTVPRHVDLVGMGTTLTSLTAGDIGAQLLFEASFDAGGPNGYTVSRGTFTGRFTLDGLAVATGPMLKIGRGNFRKFEDILVTRCVNSGIELNQTQNCVFDNVAVTVCGGFGFLLLDGTTWNLFSHCYTNNCLAGAVRCRNERDVVALGWNANLQTISRNKFISCTFEYFGNDDFLDDNTAEPPYVAQLDLGTSRGNQFVACAVYSAWKGGLTGTERRPMVRIYQHDKGGPNPRQCRETIFNSCTFEGRSTRVTIDNPLGYLAGNYTVSGITVAPLGGVVPNGTVITFTSGATFTVSEQANQNATILKGTLAGGNLGANSSALLPIKTSDVFWMTDSTSVAFQGVQRLNQVDTLFVLGNSAEILGSFETFNTTAYSQVFKSGPNLSTSPTLGTKGFLELAGEAGRKVLDFNDLNLFREACREDMLRDTPKTVKLFNHCLNNQNTDEFSYTQSGTGAGFTPASVGPSDGAVGVLRINLGTTATGRAAIASASPFGQYLLNTGRGYTASRVKFVALSDATNTYTFRTGRGDSVTGSHTDSVNFRYTHAENGGKFLCVAIANGVETTADSGVSVAVDTWYTLEIVTNANATEARYYINGVLVGTITTNIPTGSGRGSALVTSVIRSAGTSSFDAVDVDYIRDTFLLN
jgi:hypothetical protein